MNLNFDLPLGRVEDKTTTTISTWIRYKWTNLYLFCRFKGTTDSNILHIDVIQLKITNVFFCCELVRQTDFLARTLRNFVSFVLWWILRIEWLNKFQNEQSMPTKKPYTAFSLPASPFKPHKRCTKLPPDLYRNAISMISKNITIFNDGCFVAVILVVLI